MEGDNTETVLYADVLFLVDFSMDTVSLWLTSKLLHSSIRGIKCGLAAAFGAVVSTVMTVLALDSAVSLILGLLTSLVMCLIVFGYGNFFRYVKNCSVLWTVGLILGGIMTFLLSGRDYTRVYTNPVPQTESSIHTLPVAVGICAVLTYFFRRVSRKKRVRVKVKMNTVTVDTVGIVDTGNFLRDPITGDGVLMLKSNVVRQIIGDVDIWYPEKIDVNEFKPRLRMIPVKTVTGEKVLPAFRPDSVKLDGREVRCIIAVTDDDLNMAECIVPEALV